MRRGSPEEERLDILFNHAPDAYYLHDLKGILVDGNLAAQRLLGYAKAELVGRSFLKLKLLAGPSLAKAAKLLAQSALGRPTGPSELVLRRKDGSRVAIEIRTHPVKIDGRTLVLGIARDLTERKRAAERERALEARLRQQEKAASIATLAGGVAHEINNPLNGILNYAQLIKDDPAAGQRSAVFAAEIVREAQRAAGIVRSLLSFSRPKSEAKSAVSAAEAVRGVADAVESELRGRRIRFEIDAPADSPDFYGNLPQVQQVLLNLVFNARDALEGRPPGPAGAGRIRISVREVRRDGRRCVRLSVEDDGPGIPGRIASRIFDPFFTTRSRADHSGLGLAAGQRIAEEHGGRLWFESAPGKATRFHLDIPAAPGRKRPRPAKP